jgi:uncharacterized protein
VRRGCKPFSWAFAQPFCGRISRKPQPLVMSQTGRMEKLSDSLLLPYHIGRIITYTTLAILLSSILNLVFLYLPIRAYVVAPILMVAGLIFLMNAFPKLSLGFRNIFPWLSSIHLYLPVYFISQPFQKLQTMRTSAIRQFLMGLLLGFMPCGLATSALLASATAPNAVEAGMAMMAFGIGTIPALVATAFAGHSLKKKYPKIMPRITQAMMVWSGLWLFIMAGIILI